MAIRLSIVFIFSLFASHSIGQNLAQHNWYFGSTSAGIRFNRGTNLPQQVNDQVVPVPPFGTGGSAVATDPATSNLLFYSDGSRVYDAFHLLMPNGGGLLGNVAGNQPIVVCAVPGQVNKYFLFANNANFLAAGSITRSVVDMSLFGNAVFPSPAQGNVEVLNKNAPVGLANRSEGMMIVPHTNGTDFWLITHQNASAVFSATLINAASYSSGTFVTTSTTPLGPTPVPVTVSNFSYNNKLRKLAVSIQSPRDDALILDFNPATGAISFDRYILNTGIATAAAESMYDIQWDIKGGRYLYISRIGEAGIAADVLQYDFLNPSATLTSVLPAPVFRSYGLQLAPDSAIYHIYQAVSSGPFLVGKFSKTDTIASQVIKTLQPFGTTNFSATQFPSFLPPTNVNLTVSFTTAGTCQNNPVSFFPNVTPNADSLRWNFGDTNTSGAWSPVHTYQQAQTFNVQLTAFYQGQRRTVTQPVTINAFTLELQLVQDTTACRSEFPAPRGTSSPTQFSVRVSVTQGSATSFNWSNGDTGQILTPDSAGYYYVVATDATGCSTYAGVNVKEYGLSDQRSNIWYFGNKAGIDFNVPPPKALNTSAMDAPAGCAIVCDRNGKAIFYTDGSNVYDKTNTLIDTGIGGDPTSTQSSLIVPISGDETLYYIFTTQEITGTSSNELRYSIFDLKQNGGNGAVTQKNILLFSKSTERITANGRWLVAHEYGNSTFRTYPITNQGIGAAVYSDIGSPHSFTSKENGQGYMKLGPRNNLAVPLSTPGTSNVIELFQLNDSTGVISNFRRVNMNQAAGQVYGVEFSPAGRKLFATIKGAPSPSALYEYYLDSLDVQIPVLVPPSPIQRPIEMGALQIAPDGQIYMAFNDGTSNTTLGTINANENRVSTPSSVNFTGFPLASGTNSRLGLPNFIQQQGNGFGGPGFSFTGICLGDTTRFNGTPTDAIDVFQWAFGDGAGSAEAAPTHLYAAAGTYTVSMRLTNRCGLDTTIVQQVRINPPPPRPTLAPASALCNGPITLDANSGNLVSITSYLWNSGATTKTIVINNPANVSVTITDVNGCTATANGIVVNNRPVLDLGPDLTVCEDNTTPNLNAFNSGANFVWTLNGAPNGNTFATQVVDTSLPAVLTYGVTVTDPITLCTATDSKTYTIKVSPTFTLSGTNPTSCNTATGTVTLNLNSSIIPGGPYSYFLSGPSFSQQGFDQSAPSTITFSPPLQGASAGTISGIVQDQISGCTISTAINLVDATFTATATTSNCNPSLVTVTTAGAVVPTPRYTFTNVATGAVIGPQAANTASLIPGTYSIQVRDNNGTGCTFAFNQIVNPVTPVLTITPNLCVSPATLVASVAGGVSFTWTLPTGGTVNGATLNLPTNGTGTYQVAADIGGGCILTQSTSIVFTGLPSPDFTQSNGCASQVVLTATPTGNFTYRWYKTGVLQAGLGGRQITLGQSEDGASYAVEVVDAVSGCFVRSAAKPVQVSGPVDATVTGTQACQDNKAFTLTSTTTATGVTYAWALNGTTIAGQSTATLSDTREGTYRVTISKATCNASASIQIIKAPIPQGELPDRVIICNDPDNKDIKTSQVDLNPGTFTTYNWLKNDIIINFTNRVLTATSEGIYQVDLTNSFGCTNSDKTEVLNECIPKIVGPNAFRPGNAVNAMNKEFFVYSFFITDKFEIAIFNRWGELVFSDTKKDFRWNGGYGNNPGQPAPGGTYSYVIKYQSSFRPEEGIKEQRGGIVLLR
ncbi:MAG: PKD domain-containing protein [Cytophagales bacterium]|nr:PKD domain-containing protein [Cytophagales bacterium]